MGVKGFFPGGPIVDFSSVSQTIFSRGEAGVKVHFTISKLRENILLRKI